MKLKLTDMAIKRLVAPQSGQATYWDDTTPGFGIRLSQKSRSFVVMYGEKRRLKTLGRYPDLALSDARKAARKFLSEAIDAPATPSIAPVTFNDAKAQFLAHCTRRLKPRTVRDYTWLLDRHFSFSGDINAITKTQIIKALNTLADTPSLQQHAFVAIRTMMNWCVHNGLLEASPVPRIRQSSSSRERILSDEELVAVYRRAKETSYPYGPIVELLILTGQRRGEIAALRRSWIADGIVTFPASFTKNKREHRLPLSPLALQVIETLPETGDLLFPARNRPDTPFSGWSKSKMRFDAGLPFSGYTLHDLRRTFSSNLARLGVPIHVTEKILNHASGSIGGVAAVYNRYSYFEEMAEALNLHEVFMIRLARNGSNS